MTKTKAFENFLKQKSNLDKPTNLIRKRNLWVKKVDNLYAEIQKWFKKYNENMTFVVSEMELREDFLGTYKINYLIIKIGKSIIYLRPKAMNIIGAKGRIDMEGPNGSIMLLINGKGEWEFMRKKSINPSWTIIPFEVNKESMMEIIEEIA